VAEVERRKWPRMRARLHVEFQPIGVPEPRSGTGTTENVSRGGLLVVTPDWHELSVGQQVFMNVSGLASHNGGPLFRTLCAAGTIVRMEAPAEAATYAKARVAVRFDRPPRVGLMDLVV